MSWHRLRSPNDALRAARRAVHAALQPLARVGLTHVPELPDGAHTNLGWDVATQRVVGRTTRDGRFAALHPSTMTLFLHDASTPDVVAARLALAGRTTDDAVAWLEALLGDEPLADTPWLGEAPTTPADDGRFPEPDEATLQLASWFDVGHRALSALATRERRATEVRVWPHHFDVAVRIVVDEGDGEDARSVGLGLSPGDETTPDPYLYVLPWPAPNPDALPSLAVGHWHTTGWIGAALDGAELVAAVEAETREARAKQFWGTGLARSLELLGDGPQLEWQRAIDPALLPEGRTTAVTLGHRTVCLTHHEGRFSALQNACPHQGGPLGEGTIENGWLRCPWHGWDFHPHTGASPGGFEDTLDTFPVEVRDDGVYVGFEPEPPRTRTVSDVMAETLEAWGVRWVFGMVGHSNLGLADAIREREEAGGMGYIGIRHEGAASFAVSAYGKLTGRLAACLSIAGPGATNLLTGLWDANVDRAPAIALTGQVDTQVLGPGAFQEVDLVAAFGKVAQFSQTVLHDSRFAELANLACKSALIHRGVSHLIFPDDVQPLAATAQMKPGGPRGRIGPPTIAPPAESLDDAAELLGAASRPVIVVGHGARFVMEPIIRLAEMLDCPVLTTFKGKGLIPDSHPLAGGVLGRSGTPIASWFMNESDLLVVFGASFSNHTGITSYKPIIQVDYDRMMLGKFHPVTVPVWGEASVTCELLIERLDDGHEARSQRAELAERWALWRDEKARRELESRGRGIHSAQVFGAMTRQVPEDAIVAVDVGNNTYSFGRYFETRAQSILMSGYLGSIGFALPAAMGAWAATQEDDPRFAERPVVSMSGDGGLGQYLAELTTLAKYQMNITHVLLNNGELGKISKEQRSARWDVWQTSLHNPDFAAFARNCGLFAVRVESADELDDALATAIAHDGPALVEIITDPMLL